MMALILLSNSDGLAISFVSLLYIIMPTSALLNTDVQMCRYSPQLAVQQTLTSHPHVVSIVNYTNIHCHSYRQHSHNKSAALNPTARQSQVYYH